MTRVTVGSELCTRSGKQLPQISVPHLLPVQQLLSDAFWEEMAEQCADADLRARDQLVMDDAAFLFVRSDVVVVEAGGGVA